MSLAELTDPAAVRQAIAEFDRLGRVDFLARYGFGKAREYMLRTADGNLYDSKAIVGAAFGFQFPERGPLGPDDFVGGETTVERKLNDLDFEVVRVGDNWTREEVQLAVADYFDMLALEARGSAYNKSEHNERLRQHLRARSKASVELKHQNISAVLDELELPYLCRIAYEDTAIVSNSVHQVSVLKRFQAERGVSSRYDGKRRYTLRFHEVAPPS